MHTEYGLGRIHGGCHMKKILLASVAAALCGAPALAADMPVKAAPMAPMFSWSGCYVGVEAGGDWGHSRHRADDRTTIVDFNADGGVFGGTLGCNAQSGQWVFGVENDLSWTGVKGHELDHPPFNVIATSGTKANWLDTLRGRIGIAVDRSLWYVTGGAAFTDIKQFGDNGAGITIAQSKSRSGWTAGFGFEQALADPHWSWKIEYLRVDFGYKLYPGDGIIFANHNINLTENIVRVGLNWRGDWGKGPVSARY